MEPKSTIMESVILRGVAVGVRAGVALTAQLYVKVISLKDKLIPTSPNIFLSYDFEIEPITILPFTSAIC